ncbi:MAG: YraN family protein [bacterium]|nr:YraN family protein [bacterium]
MNDQEDKRTEKRKTGDKGEDIAAEFLLKQGFIINDRNYLKKYGELDIVAFKSDIWHFIEVKTVSCEIETYKQTDKNDRYRPEDNIHSWKLKRLSRVIQAYIIDKKLNEADWQFDVITIFIDYKARKAALEFLENIVL